MAENTPLEVVDGGLVRLIKNSTGQEEWVDARSAPRHLASGAYSAAAIDKSVPEHRKINSGMQAPVAGEGREYLQKDSSDSGLEKVLRTAGHNFLSGALVAPAFFESEQDRQDRSDNPWLAIASDIAGGAAMGMAVAGPVGGLVGAAGKTAARLGLTLGGKSALKSIAKWGIKKAAQIGLGAATHTAQEVGREYSAQGDINVDKAVQTLTDSVRTGAITQTALTALSGSAALGRMASRAVKGAAEQRKVAQALLDRGMRIPKAKLSEAEKKIAKGMEENLTKIQEAHGVLSGRARILKNEADIREKKISELFDEFHNTGSTAAQKKWQEATRLRQEWDRDHYAPVINRLRELNKHKDELSDRLKDLTSENLTKYIGGESQAIPRAVGSAAAVGSGWIARSAAGGGMPGNLAAAAVGNVAYQAGKGAANAMGWNKTTGDLMYALNPSKSKELTRKLIEGVTVGKFGKAAGWVTRNLESIADAGGSYGTISGSMKAGQGTSEEDLDYLYGDTEYAQDKNYLMKVAEEQGQAIQELAKQGAFVPGLAQSESYQQDMAAYSLVKDRIESGDLNDKSFVRELKRDINLLMNPNVAFDYAQEGMLSRWQIGALQQTAPSVYEAMKKNAEEALSYYKMYNVKPSGRNARLMSSILGVDVGEGVSSSKGFRIYQDIVGGSQEGQQGGGKTKTGYTSVKNQPGVDETTRLQRGR